MNTSTGTKALGIMAASVTLLASPWSVSQVAFASSDLPHSEHLHASNDQTLMSGGERLAIVKEAVVPGVFSATQDAITSTEELAKAFKHASSTLCGNELHEEGLNHAAVSNDAQSWSISIEGSVRHAFSATMQELVDEHAQTSVMGCTCASNPTDGRATANAKASGASVKALIAAAVPTVHCNTITFVGSDGTQASMPLWYVFTHAAIIATEINDEPLDESMGGTVQLWIDSTPASYFVRNVVAIRLTAEENPPAAPSAEDTFSDSPNVTVLSGSSAQSIS